MIRQTTRSRYSDSDARTAEDVSTIDGWLASEGGRMHLQVQHAREEEASGKYRWLIGGGPLVGCPDNWSLEVIYATRSPNVLAVLVVVTEPLFLPDDLLHSFRPIFHDHGLQPHASRDQHMSGAGSTAETRWGAQQGLQVGPLSEGLLGPVVGRLLAAVRDAMTTRARQRS
jgi:hypothetical protein